MMFKNKAQNCSSDFLNKIRLLLIASILIVTQIYSEAIIPVFGQDNNSHQEPAYTIHDEMIPMRDGIKLHTIIVIPSNPEHKCPILIERTPYNACGRASRRGTCKVLRRENAVFAHTGRITQETGVHNGISS